MSDTHDVVIGIAASLYASQATEDALRGEPNLEALANSESHGEASRRANPGGPGIGRAETKQ